MGHSTKQTDQLKSNVRQLCSRFQTALRQKGRKERRTLEIAPVTCDLIWLFIDGTLKTGCKIEDYLFGTETRVVFAISYRCVYGGAGMVTLEDMSMRVEGEEIYGRLGEDEHA